MVKGVQFRDHWDAGEPVELARRYAAESADEITFLDIGASLGSREILRDTVWSTAGQVFVPLCVGGGVRSVEDVDWLLRAGADKTAVNTAAIQRPELVRDISSRFGAQCTVISMDVRRSPDTPSGFEVTTHAGTRGTGIDAIDWAQRVQELGAGEILLNSMDNDGTQQGFDVELIHTIRQVTSVPLIASGGAGTAQHFVDAVLAGSDAVLGASVFHRQTLSIGEVKDAMRAAGVVVR